MKTAFVSMLSVFSVGCANTIVSVFAAVALLLVSHFCGCSETHDLDDKDGSGPSVDASPSDQETKHDGIGDATRADLPANGITVGTLVMLPLLDPGHYQHTNEPSIAAHDGHVVVAYRNRHLTGADGWVPDPDDNSRQNAIAVSHAGDETFALRTIPDAASFSSDPVVRVDQHGRFWFAQIEDAKDSTCAVASSEDNGDTWGYVTQGLPCLDKEWIAVDGSSLYLMGLGGWWKFSTDVPFKLTASADHVAGVHGTAYAGYVDAKGAHFVSITVNTPNPYLITVWNGEGSPAIDDGPIAGFPFGSSETEPSDQSTSISIGRTEQGARWVVCEEPRGKITVGVHPSNAAATSFTTISNADTTAFFPAAALDMAGHLHVIWYESGPGRGELVYSRSLSNDLSRGFAEPLTIDEKAVPPDGWHPVINPGDDAFLRLREYIDLATDGARAHLAWTRAQTAPSRVMTSYVEHR